MNEEEEEERGRRKEKKKRRTKKNNIIIYYLLDYNILNNNKNWIKDFNNNTAVDYCYLLAPFEEKKLWGNDSYDEGEKYHRTIW